MEDKITEKVYCYDHPSAYRQDNTPMWAALMSNHNNGYDSALLANQWQNNPFAYMMILGMMRFMYGDNWQNGGNSEINSRFNQLTNQMSDNHNTDILNETIKGNTARVGELANNLNVDLRTISAGICDVKSGIAQVAGDMKFSAERVINAVNLGDTNIITALKDCCCQNKELVQRMGYENQLAQKDLLNAMGQQTLQLGERFTGIANGIQQGFSAVAYESQRQTCDIINAGKDNTQRIIDVLNNHWQADLQQRYSDARLELSQKAQNEYLINQLKNNGCGCGC